MKLPSAHLLLTLTLFAAASRRAEEPVIPLEAVAVLPDAAFISSNPKPESGSIERVGDGWRLTSPGKTTTITVKHSTYGGKPTVKLP